MTGDLTSLPQGGNLEQKVQNLNGAKPPPVEKPVEPPAEGTPVLSAAVDQAKNQFLSSKPQEVKIKRGPGRPRKDGTIRSQSIPGQAPSNLSAPATQPPPDISHHIVAPLISISNIPAAKYKIPELALTREEADLCAKSLQELLNAFVPDLGQMNPKTAAIMGAVMTFGMVFISKMQIYNMKIALIQEKIENSDAQIIKSDNSKNPLFTTEAHDYFKRPGRENAF